MKYLRLAIAIMFAVSVQSSYADSIPTFHITEATMNMAPNDGSGDNVFFSFTGPGVNITGTGGMGCFDWCSTTSRISDPSIAGTGQIFISSFDSATIGGISYEATLLSLDIFDAFGGLNASTAGFVGEGESFFQFRMTAPTNGSWHLNFAPTVDQDGNPVFVFTDGSFSARAPLPTPEPATVGLMLTGLAGIAGIVKRKAKFRR